MIDCHTDVVLCMSFNTNGSLLGTTCKDKRLRVIEPRSGRVLQVRLGGLSEAWLGGLGAQVRPHTGRAGGSGEVTCSCSAPAPPCAHVFTLLGRGGLWHTLQCFGQS